jgi:LPXTG-motif cell wall-anchored protein
MKTVRLALAAAVVAFMTLVAPMAAEAYPGLTCNVSDRTVVGGHHVQITVTVTPSNTSDFELTYQGHTRTGSGTSFTRTFDTPKVNDTTETTAFATVTQNGNTSECTGTITLLARHGDDDDDEGNGNGDGDGGGILPNTGGERLLWLIIGGLLVMTGGGVVMASRRRDA